MTQQMTDSRAVRLVELWPTVPDSERLVFAALPGSRQELALSRLQAMREFEVKSASPSTLMHKLQLSRTHFYRLVREWRSSPTLASLVPYAAVPKPRSSKLDSRVIDIANRVLLDHAQSRIVASEASLVREIQANVGGWNLPIPAESSVRRLIAALAAKDPILQQSAVAREQRELDFTDAFGGRIMVDHSTMDLICTDGSISLRPTISLVMDDATRLILASQLAMHIPGAADTLAVLAQASAGYQGIKMLGASAPLGLHPVLTMRMGQSPEWTEVQSLASTTRMKLDTRTNPQPVFGHVLRRSMVTRIERFQLLPRYTMQPPSERIRSNDEPNLPGVSWEDALSIFKASVARHNRDRFKALPDHLVDGATTQAGLRLNTERRDWLEYGLDIFNQKTASAI